MHWLLEKLQEGGDRVVFIEKGIKKKYSEAFDCINSWSAILKCNSVLPGQKVVIKGDFSFSAFCVLIALIINKNIAIPLSSDLDQEEKKILSISGCDWFIFTEALSDDIDNFEIKSLSISSNNQTLERFQERKIAGLIFFSSGSSGPPKGILHDAEKVLERFKRPTRPFVGIPFLKIDHFGGINTIFSIAASLSTAIIAEDRSCRAICQSIEENKVTLLPTTPSFLNLLLVSQAYKEFDLSSLQKITYGTEVMPESTLAKLNKIFPNIKFQQTYGLSEVGVLQSVSRGDGSLWMKIGGVGYKIKVIDDILWIKSDYAMVGYLNEESSFDGDGWFNTQDRVQVDGEFLKILGRDSEIINVGGKKVYPAEVENVILNLSNISDVAVFGEAHPILGQIVVAKVNILNPESADVLKARIRKFCLSSMESYKAPMKIYVSSQPLLSYRHKKIRRV